MTRPPRLVGICYPERQFQPQLAVGRFRLQCTFDYVYLGPLRTARVSVGRLGLQSAVSYTFLSPTRGSASPDTRAGRPRVK